MGFPVCGSCHALAQYILPKSTAPATLQVRCSQFGLFVSSLASLKGEGIIPHPICTRQPRDCTTDVVLQGACLSRL